MEIAFRNHFDIRSMDAFLPLYFGRNFEGLALKKGLQLRYRKKKHSRGAGVGRSREPGDWVSEWLVAHPEGKAEPFSLDKWMGSLNSGLALGLLSQFLTPMEKHSQIILCDTRFREMGNTYLGIAGNSLPKGLALAEKPDLARGLPITVLVVDDEPPVLRLMASVLNTGS